MPTSDPTNPTQLGRSPRGLRSHGAEGPSGPAVITLCSEQVLGHLEAECGSFPREKQTLTYLEQHDNI